MHLYVTLVCVFVGVVGRVENSTLPQGCNYQGPAAEELATEPPVQFPKTSFSCWGRYDGYYADVEVDCTIFHYCQTWHFPTGLNETVKWDFVCPQTTIFNQKLLSCTPPSIAFDCKESVNYFWINHNLADYVPTTNKQPQQEIAPSQQFTDAGSNVPPQEPFLPFPNNENDGILKPAGSHPQHVDDPNNNIEPLPPYPSSIEESYPPAIQWPSSWGQPDSSYVPYPIDTITTNVEPHSPLEYPTDSGSSSENIHPPPYLHQSSHHLPELQNSLGTEPYLKPTEDKPQQGHNIPQTNVTDVTSHKPEQLDSTEVEGRPNLGLANDNIEHSVNYPSELTNNYDNVVLVEQNPDVSTTIDNFEPGKFHQTHLIDLENQKPDFSGLYENVAPAVMRPTNSNDEISHGDSITVHQLEIYMGNQNFVQPQYADSNLTHEPVNPYPEIANPISNFGTYNSSYIEPYNPAYLENTGTVEYNVFNNEFSVPVVNSQHQTDVIASNENLKPILHDPTGSEIPYENVYSTQPHHTNTGVIYYNPDNDKPDNSSNTVIYNNYPSEWNRPNINTQYSPVALNHIPSNPATTPQEENEGLEVLFLYDHENAYIKPGAGAAISPDLQNFYENVQPSVVPLLSEQNNLQPAAQYPWDKPQLTGQNPPEYVGNNNHKPAIFLPAELSIGNDQDGVTSHLLDLSNRNVNPKPELDTQFVASAVTESVFGGFLSERNSTNPGFENSEPFASVEKNTENGSVQTFTRHPTDLFNNSNLSQEKDPIQIINYTKFDMENSNIENQKAKYVIKDAQISNQSSNDKSEASTEYSTQSNSFNFFQSNLADLNNSHLAGLQHYVKPNLLTNLNIAIDDSENPTNLNLTIDHNALETAVSKSNDTDSLQAQVLSTYVSNDSTESFETDLVPDNENGDLQATIIYNPTQMTFYDEIPGLTQQEPDSVDPAGTQNLGSENYSNETFILNANGLGDKSEHDQLYSTKSNASGHSGLQNFFGSIPYDFSNLNYNVEPDLKHSDSTNKKHLDEQFEKTTLQTLLISQPDPEPTFIVHSNEPFAVPTSDYDESDAFFFPSKPYPIDFRNSNSEIKDYDKSSPNN